uniref:Regulator of G-protein signaling 16 n=1 Tax=Equus caballus TaxID=9796 RepID=A0A3Q2I525_HORSE
SPPPSSPRRAALHPQPCAGPWPPSPPPAWREPKSSRPGWGSFFTNQSWAPILGVLASLNGAVNTAKRDGVAAFHAFLKTEFSEENLEFWLACEEYKKIHSATKLASQAHRIFEEFICSEAPKEVNIDHETRELTRTNLQAATATCFDVAQGKTRTLMEKDSYPRFLKSPAYRDLAAQTSATSASPSNCSPAEPLHT